MRPECWQENVGRLQHAVARVNASATVEAKCDGVGTGDIRCIHRLGVWQFCRRRGNTDGRGRHAELRHTIHRLAQVWLEAQMHLFEALCKSLEIVGDVGQRHDVRQPARRGAELRRSLTEDAGGTGLHQATG